MEKRVVKCDAVRPATGLRAGLHPYGFGKGISRMGIARRIFRDRAIYLMFLPCLAYFIIFHYIPIWGARIAFQEYRFFGANPWVGLKHFTVLFSSPTFLNVLRNTIIISFMKILINFPMPIILALLLVEVRSVPYRRIVQSIVYLPHFLSWVVIAGIFINALSINRGIVNEIIGFFGGDAVPFMTSHAHIRWVFVYSEMWRSIGWDSILFVAAIFSISTELFEAALMDGCSRLQKIFHIVLPCIFPTIVTVFILNLGFFMNAGFDQVFNMMNDSVISVADILDTYVYRVGLLNADFSYGTAAGLFKSSIGVVLIFTTHNIAKKFSSRGLW